MFAINIPEPEPLYNMDLNYSFLDLFYDEATKVKSERHLESFTQAKYNNEEFQQIALCSCFHSFFSVFVIVLSRLSSSPHHASSE